MTIPRRIAKRLIAVLVCAGASRAGAQASVGVRRVVGDVVEAVTGRPVTQAQVSLRGTALVTRTDLSGHFVLQPVAPGRYVVDVRRIGYEPLASDSFAVGAGDEAHLTFTMTPSAFRLADVTVTPGSFSFLDAGPQSRQRVSRADIEAAPNGEDLFRALNRLPGLSSGDYGAQFSIRGGRRDETLILLDGLELYEPFHLKDFAEGALSIVDVEAIDGVELLTGGFPARYGDKRSGVMLISTRTPKEDGVHLTLGASFTNAHALAEGTFANRKGSWLVSGRRGFVDLLLGIIKKKETKTPAYEDIFATVRYKIHANHALALNLLYAGDRYRFSVKGSTGFKDTIKTRETANNGYGNSYVWVTLRSLVGQHLSVRTLASIGDVNASRHGDETVVSTPLEIYGVDGNRGFTVSGLKQEFTYQRSSRMVLDWGYDWRWMHAHFDWTNRVRQNPDDPTPDTLGYYPHVTSKMKSASGRTVGAYVSDRIQILGPLTLELGVRYDGATYTGDRDWSPRLHLLAALSARDALRAGWGRYAQRQGIADENAFDALNRYFRSEQSNQWTLGFEHRYTGRGSLRAEAYHKSGSRLRPILRNWKSGLNVFPEIAEDRLLVYPRATTSRGMELYLDRSFGTRLDLRAGYALAFVEEQLSRVDQLNDPFKPPFSSTHASPQDQRHALNLDLTYRPFGNWSVTTAYTFHSGWPYTSEIAVPVKKKNGAMDLAVRPDTLYGSRLPPYHRLDVRVTRRLHTATSDWRIFLEVINATNHENVLGYDVFRVTDATGTLGVQRETETWFSILPSVGVSWSKRF